MVEQSSIVALDLGAESGRAMLGRLSGGKLRLSELHRFVNQPVHVPAASDGGSHLHWDILRLWAGIKEGLIRAVREHGHDLVSVGLDTWGVDFALLDRQGNLVSNPYHYRDTRTDGMVEEAIRRVPRKEIYELTGIQFMPFNTLYQLLAMVVSDAPALEVAESFLTMPDLFNYWLTDRRVCEFTNATTTQCYDPLSEGWASSLLRRLGIPTAIFPEIVPPGTVLGEVRPSLGEELGAPGLRVIAPACHDTGSAVAAVPADASHFAYISSGTWSLMGAELRAPKISPAALNCDFTNEGGVDGTFRFLKNIAGLWLLQQCRHTWACRGDELSYDALTRMAAQAVPLRSIIDVDAPAFSKPGDMPARIRRCCRKTGQPVPESKGAVVRCVLESLAIKYRWVLDRLEEVLGYHLEPVHIVGGGTQNKLLNQFAADACGRRVVAGPVEATAAGNILIQAIALGHIESLDQAREIVRSSFDLTSYEPTKSSRWDEVYRQVVPALVCA